MTNKIQAEQVFNAGFWKSEPRADAVEFNFMGKDFTVEIYGKNELLGKDNEIQETIIVLDHENNIKPKGRVSKYSRCNYNGDPLMFAMPILKGK